MLLQRLYIGLNDKDTLKQKLSIRKAKQIINNVLRDRHVSYTLIQGVGVFLGEPEEKTIILETVVTGEELLISKDEINQLCKGLNQLCIMELVQPIQFDMIVIQG